MKYLLIILAFVLSACSTKNASYILPTPNQVAVVANFKRQIGVKKITLPEYLNSDKILVKNGYQIKSINAYFATSADKLFTQKAILSFKRALNNPNVFLYPWGVADKKGYIVEINIDDYLYSNGIVNLNGTYYIKNAKNIVLFSKNFSFAKNSKDNVNSIVESLNELFENLIIEIAQKIAK